MRGEDQTGFGGRAADARRPLLVEPDVFHPPAVVDAVGHCRQSPDIGLPASSAASVIDDGPGALLLQSLVDLPNELPALFLVRLSRLSVEQLLDLAIAVAGVIARRIAGVILVELLVGIIDGTGDAGDTDLVILAGELGEPEARFDRLELAVDVNILQLVDQDH